MLHSVSGFAMLRHKQGVFILLSLAGLHGWLRSGGGSTALAASVALSAPRPQQPAGLQDPRAHLAKGQNALATFNELKNKEADLDSEFAEDVRKELQPADPK